MNRMPINCVKNEIKDHSENLEAMEHEITHRSDYLNAMCRDLQEAQENAKAKVLIVDDICTDLIMANNLLSPYNMRVRLCKNGFNAIDEIQSKEYDLVFMDYQMPGMDGVETTRRIRDMVNADNYYIKLPIVALTSYDASGAREMFLESGFDDFLAKPIDKTKLNTILKKWIPGSKHEAE